MGGLVLMGDNAVIYGRLVYFFSPIIHPGGYDISKGVFSKYLSDDLNFLVKLIK